MDRVLVSKCLLGHNCQFDGTSADRRLEEWLIERLGCSIVEACPEELAGLPTPRKRMALIGGDGRDVLSGRARVKTADGEDLTEVMLAGARATLDLARKHGATKMIARRRSPSCSCRQVFDSFSGRLVEGQGVTVALLRSETDIAIVELEELVVDLLQETLREAIRIYGRDADWTSRRTDVVTLLRERMLWVEPQPWSEILRNAFRDLIPALHKGLSDSTAPWDSDTVRFFQEAFRGAFGIELIDPKKRCRICTYPEGFLDSHLGRDNVCSACAVYGQHKDLLTDYRKLGTILRTKLDEIRGKYRYDAIAALSGGKDSTYMLLKLRRDYDANTLCVMDELEQQNQEAIQNAKQAARLLEAEFRILEPPPETRAIRRNFLLAGNSFCRLCLRSHLVRVYQVAIAERIPLVFFGMTPYQCFDCVDAIRWSVQAIRDVATPLDELNHDSVLRRYKHRAFQGGFDVGFVEPNEKGLYAEWERIFDEAPRDFAPLIVPFFVFERYPADAEIMETISREIAWQKPEMLLDHTNCRLLRLAGIMHRGIGRYHLNYKERATRLRFAGVTLSEEQSRAIGSVLNRSIAGEEMSRSEFDDALGEEFGLSFEELPGHVQERLAVILEQNKGDIL